LISEFPATNSKDCQYVFPGIQVNWRKTCFVKGAEQNIGTAQSSVTVAARSLTRNPRSLCSLCNPHNGKAISMCNPRNHNLNSITALR